VTALTLSPALQYHSHAGSFTVWDIMHALIGRSLACFLILCILAVGGFASAQSLTHDSQHSHHQKATHGTVLCSWMCAAGQAGEAATVFVPLDVVPHEFIELASTDQGPALFLTALATRGPPLR
jgi:hypothetical protein